MHTCEGGSGTNLNWLQLIILARLQQLKNSHCQVCPEEQASKIFQENVIMIDSPSKNKNATMKQRFSFFFLKQ